MHRNALRGSVHPNRTCVYQNIVRRLGYGRCMSEPGSIPGNPELGASVSERFRPYAVAAAVGAAVGVTLPLWDWLLAVWGWLLNPLPVG